MLDISLIENEKYKIFLIFSSKNIFKFLKGENQEKRKEKSEPVFQKKMRKFEQNKNEIFQTEEGLKDMLDISLLGNKN